MSSVQARGSQTSTPVAPDINDLRIRRAIAANIISGSRWIAIDLSHQEPTLIFGAGTTPHDWHRAQQVLDVSVSRNKEQ